MAHFAKIVDGVVVKVLVAEPEFFDTFFDDSPGKWLQTSYNTYKGVHWTANRQAPSADQTKALRKNYATIGYSYDESLDAFIPPKPFPSWILNETTCHWEAPTPMPNSGPPVRWNEQTQAWVEFTDGIVG